MEAFANIISLISSFLYSYILIALLIAAGLYFTIKTGFIQFRLFGESIRVIAEKREDRESISSFQALMVSTASRVGTGNVVGVTGAIIAGGAGAVFWMWLIAIIGSASAFIESTLAQIYKKKGEDGTCYGGPASMAPMVARPIISNRGLALRFWAVPLPLPSSSPIWAALMPLLPSI